MSYTKQKYNFILGFFIVYNIKKYIAYNKVGRVLYKPIYTNEYFCYYMGRGEENEK